uniref:hypothetical protein n=1 Tax=Reticulibacter mediterranei TaxID=2778369 RepID=UPI001F34436D|nr:hypothetical protein [Reticulibacter mediterranei]
MKFIGYLLCLGNGAAGCRCIITSAIPTDQKHSMLGQNGQQISHYRLTAFGRGERWRVSIAQV